MYAIVTPTIKTEDKDRTMTELKRMRNEFLMFVGLAVIVLVIGGGIVWAVYSVIGELTDPGRHWLATGLAFAVPIAYVLGLQSAKAHRKGIERGIDLKLGARERAQQRPIVTPAATAPAQSAAASAATQAARWNNDLLPGGQAVIVTRRDTNTDPIEM